MAFLAPVDLVNRACQHLGVDRILASEFTTPVTKQGGELCFLYDKVRRAELRRNLWRFATKRAMLYPVDVNTLLFTPGAWSASTTYYPGAVVADSSGNLFASGLNDNLNNTPGFGSTIWEPYFGVITVDPWTNPLAANTTPVSQAGYFAGDIVYVEMPSPYAAGTASVFRSILQGNTENPQVPDAWDATRIYTKNQIVTFSNVLYISSLNGNLNQEPDTQTSWWSVYVATYAAGTTYTAGQFVLSSSVLYQSRVSGNIGHTPASSATQWMTMNAAWAIGTSYHLNQTVVFGGVLYQSTVEANLGHTPGVDGNWSTPATNQPYGSNRWLQLPSTTTLSPLAINYPLNTGPSSQTNTLNIFRLPNNFLRRAPDDPKADVFAWLGAPVGNAAKDWVFEGNYIVSRASFPLLLRFVGDVQDVTRMDDMFCEGLSARLAEDGCETITQKADMKAALRAIYNTVMGEAREVDGIERGWQSIPEDDFISVRR